ncbi:MAG: hypothetical protein HYS27_07460 [Deltaproteobacteria bacterium]|nr:hypothetical protein [Deltaproteobacteria bacterium]
MLALLLAVLVAPTAVADEPPQQEQPTAPATRTVIGATPEEEPDDVEAPAASTNSARAPAPTSRQAPVTRQTQVKDEAPAPWVLGAIGGSVGSAVGFGVVFGATVAVASVAPMLFLSPLVLPLLASFVALPTLGAGVASFAALVHDVDPARAGIAAAAEGAGTCLGAIGGGFLGAAVGVGVGYTLRTDSFTAIGIGIVAGAGAGGVVGAASVGVLGGFVAERLE